MCTALINCIALPPVCCCCYTFPRYYEHLVQYCYALRSKHSLVPATGVVSTFHCTQDFHIHFAVWSQCLSTVIQVVHDFCFGCKRCTLPSRLSHLVQLTLNLFAVVSTTIVLQYISKVLTNVHPIYSYVHVYVVHTGPCQLLAPEIMKVAEALGDKCRVFKIDADKEEAIASSLHVYGLPTLLYLKDGEIVFRTEGAMQAQTILEVVDAKLLGKGEPADASDGLFIDTK
jgi:thioredoxin 1